MGNCIIHVPVNHKLVFIIIIFFLCCSAQNMGCAAMLETFTMIHVTTLSIQNIKRPQYKKQSIDSHT